MTALEIINKFFTPAEFYMLIMGSGFAIFGAIFVWAQKKPSQDDNIEQ